MLFKNRVDAGQRLARVLSLYKGADVVVYGLARGGIVLAAEVANTIGGPLDILIPRKIGHPLQPEYGIGAVMEDGLTEMGRDDVADRGWLDMEIIRQRTEARRMREMYVGARESPPVEGRIAIVIDDGIATGLTMKLAIKSLRQRQPLRIIVAVPVIPVETHRWLINEADEVVALEIADQFAGAVGSYYDDFEPVEDAEVVKVVGAVSYGIIPHTI
jgi:predicted phosphoribosyltransferase